MAKIKPFHKIVESQVPIRVVDYMITAQCNLHCPFCYGPDPSKKVEMSQDQVELFLGFMASQGIKGIVIAGGEPLISQHLGTVLDTAQKLKIQVALQTNALTPHLLEPHLSKLSWLCVPIDGTTAAINLELRTSKTHFASVMKSLALAQRYRAQGLRLKIGTVVAPANLADLIDLAAIVQDISPDVWKWYQVRPRGQGFYNFKSLHVSVSQILEAESKVRQMYPSLQLVVSLIPDTVKAYLIVNPDSEVVVPQFDSYLSFGLLINEDLTVNLPTWHNCLRSIDKHRHEQNVLQTFPGKMAEAYNRSDIQEDENNVFDGAI